MHFAVIKHKEFIPNTLHMSDEDPKDANEKYRGCAARKESKQWTKKKKKL